ncbi:MAG: protein kinase, partial [Gemmatimonadaceae bacterium]
MNRLSAALSDRYRIERELGAGGMATVYLAEDLKHKRRVAVKVLKPELAAVLGAERFVVEIKTTAALQHPHILPLFDSGTADGFLYYVMPFIDGETLRDKLTRETQLGVDEAVKITTEVADALHYAHTHGVIHRDIKPENILLANGRPIVADFGIALALSAAAGGRLTETGLSLGTPHYMSPEQATAEKEISARSDVYSLASVAYEMLAGEPPHMGNSAQQIIMKIISETPRPVTDLRKAVPVHVAAALAQALEKIPADRFSSAAEFAAALEGRIATRSGAQQVQASRVDARWRRIAMATGVVAMVFALLAGTAFYRTSARPANGLRTEMAFRMGTGVTDRTRVTISADGRKILQSIQDSVGVMYLAIRDLGSTAVHRIPGTDGAVDPGFSPDGKSIAVMSDGELRRMAVGGGPSTVLADSVTAGAYWGKDGWIYYTHADEGLWRVPESGGASEQITVLDTARREFNHWYPQLLPSGRAVIFNSFSTPIARSRIEAVELGSGKRSVLIEGAVFARYVPSGHLLFVRDGAIFAVRFDAKQLRVLGTAVPVVDDLAWTPTDGTAGFEVSDNGTLVYLKASEWSVERRVVWADRAGNETTAIAETALWAEPRLSPDGRWMALTRKSPAWQVWLFDINRRVLTQLTRSQGVSFNAVWMPDSRSIIHTVETPVYDLHRIAIDGSASDTVRTSKSDKMASSVSPDGKSVAYHETNDRDRLMIAPIAGGEARLVERRETSQRNAAFSPVGGWVSYDEFNASGQSEIFVRSVNGGGRRQVSADGGSQSRWTRGGRELIYRKGDAVIAVSFDPSTGEVGAPTLLFRKRDAGRS